MKKLYTSLLVLSAAMISLHSQTLMQRGNNEPFMNASLYEQHTASAPAAPTVQYTNDIIIENAPGVDQGRVRISVAFNGWLYAAYNTIDTLSGDGGIVIRGSRDNGISWNTIDNYSVPGVVYPAFDIVVAGTDTNNLVLYLVGVNHNISGSSFILYVDRYNATTGNFINSNYNMQNGTRAIYDVSIASDYRFPAVGASPYGVGFLYSTYGPSYDSIVFIGSVDGGVTWATRQPVMKTGNYFRKVSIAYGRSANASNGRYFGAWEMLSSSVRTGHIYTSRSTTTTTSAWITPVNLDSVSSTMINLCANPQMAVQFSGGDNDSASVTAIVLCQRDYNGDGSDYDLLGFYNKRAHFSNYWNRLDIVNSGENDLQPDVSYDPGFNNFIATYYDSTNGKLPYIVTGMNLLTPSAWTTITPQYNDQSNNLRAAYPRVEIDQATTMAASAWIAKGVGAAAGVAMFDAEYLYTSVQAQSHGGLSLNPYPNPASGNVNVGFGVESTQDVSMSIFNMNGQLISSRNLGTVSPGQHIENFDVSTWNNGVYFVRVNTNNSTLTRSIVVAH